MARTPTRWNRRGTEDRSHDRGHPEGDQQRLLRRSATSGRKKACTELGATCEQVGPTEATGAAQTEFINTEIQKGVDAIVISAADADSVTPSLQQAKAAGITVVTYDADVNDTSARLGNDQAHDA